MAKGFVLFWAFWLNLRNRMDPISILCGKLADPFQVNDQGPKDQIHKSNNNQKVQV